MIIIIIVNVGILSGKPVNDVKNVRRKIMLEVQVIGGGNKLF